VTNRPILEGRLRERLREKNIASCSQYYDLVTHDQGELRAFLDSVTTNLTRFFRNQAHFDALQHYVIPELQKTRTNKTIHIWSAGCSSGEEPYSIAMLLQEILPFPWKYDILASDLSLKCLMTAKEGFYNDSKIVGVPPNYLTKYFDKMEGGYKIKQDIKSHIRFDYHNLINDTGVCGLDIVFCRNVLIYFDEETQTKVVNKFYDSLAPQSFLYIGHSESLFGMNTKFEFVKTQWTTLYKKS
jgi:chemotaxis protein methyltransferase CheR